MNLKTFTAESMAYALKLARDEFGEEVMIVNTKEIRKKTLTTPALFEIVVAVEDDAKKSKAKNRDINNISGMSDDVILNLSETVKQISKIAEVTENDRYSNYSHKNRQQIATTETTPKLKKLEESSQENRDNFTQKVPYKEIQTEIGKLSDRVKLIQNMIWDNKDKGDSKTIIPPEFAEIYRLSKNSGMTKEHLNEIMKLSIQHMPLSMRQNSETVKRYFNVLLRKLTPIRMEHKLKKPNKKIMMLVGPTGVGKTTTIAKLAARFAYKTEIKYKVGIITVDTYRIGAVEQLMHYAKIMKLGIESVEDPLDFSNAIHSLKHCDYILIDTAGSSQHDHEKITKLKQFLDAEHEMSIDVTLVLSCTQKYEDLRDVYKNFSILGIDTIIATKLDETTGFGNIFSLVYDTKKPLSYFSAGQEVPDDLQVATGDFLTDCLLNGFKRDEK